MTSTTGMNFLWFWGLKMEIKAHSEFQVTDPPWVRRLSSRPILTRHRKYSSDFFIVWKDTSPGTRISSHLYFMNSSNHSHTQKMWCTNTIIRIMASHSRKEEMGLSGTRGGQGKVTREERRIYRVWRWIESSRNTCWNETAYMKHTSMTNENAKF